MKTAQIDADLLLKRMKEHDDWLLHRHRLLIGRGYLNWRYGSWRAWPEDWRSVLPSEDELAGWLVMQGDRRPYGIGDRTTDAARRRVQGRFA